MYIAIILENFGVATEESQEELGEEGNTHIHNQRPINQETVQKNVSINSISKRADNLEEQVRFSTRRHANDKAICIEYSLT